MLNSSSYTILSFFKCPCTSHFKGVKCNVKKSIILANLTIYVVIPSIASWARLYAHLKIHKTTFALCLIFFSNVVTISYKLAHFLLQSQPHLICIHLYIVKNSYYTVDKLKHIFSSKYTVLSLDVKFLFINIPIQGVFDYLGKRLCEFHYSSVIINSEYSPLVF